LSHDLLLFDVIQNYQNNELVRAQSFFPSKSP